MAQGFFYGDADRARIDRQQAMLDALSAGARDRPVPMTGGRQNWGAALADAISAGAGVYGTMQNDKERKALDEQTQLKQQEFFDKFPQSREEVPMQPGTLPQEVPATQGSAMPPAELGGGPEQPAMEAQTIPGKAPVLGTPEYTPTTDDYVRHAIKGLNISPTTAAYAGSVLAEKTKMLNPKDRAITVPGGYVDSGSGKYFESPGYTAEMKSRQDERIDRLAEREAEAIRRSQDKALDRASQERWHTEAVNARKEMAAALAAMKDGPTVNFAGVNDDGERMMMDTKSGETFSVSRDASGKVVRKYSNGPIVPPAALEKEVGQVRELNNTRSETGELHGIVDSNRGAFGPMNSIINSVNDIPKVGKAIGTWLTTQKFTPEQLAARADVASRASRALKEAIGTAQTRGETGVTDAWVPKPEDSPEMLMAKLRSAQMWSERKLGSHSKASRVTAGIRLGDEAKPAAEKAAAAPLVKPVRKDGESDADWKTRRDNYIRESMKQ